MLPRSDVERRLTTFVSRVEARDPFREQTALERPADAGGEQP
jgi:hypothetical protein